MTGIVSLPQVQTGLLSGDPVSYLAGTGQSGPRGIEAFFEYNGAYLNIHDWLDTFIIQSIDGLNDADVRDAREVNPGRHGETAFDAYYGGRTLVLSGKIRASSIEKLRDMQQGLRQIFTDLSQERPLIIRSGDINSDLQIYCRKNQPLVMAEAQADKRFERAFQVTLRASNPRFTSFVEVVSVRDFTLTNFVTNPSFGIDTSGWGQNPISWFNAGATITRTVTDGYSGSSSAQVVTPASPGGTGLGIAMSPSGGFIAGQPYTATVMVKGNVGADGRLLLGSTATDLSQATFTFSAGWTQYTVTWTPSASAATAYVGVRHDSPTATSFLVDAVMVVAGATAPAYFDGSMAGYAWTGTPHASTSINAFVNQTAFTVSNNGNFSAQPIFRITGPLNSAVASGPALRIRNDHPDSLQQIIVNAKAGSTVALAAGRMMEINIANRTMKEYDAAGVFVANGFGQLDTTSDWIELPAGSNPIEVQNYAAPIPIVEMRHRHTYM
jgi:hypothetical protein